MPSRILRESVRTSPTLAQVSRGAECLFHRLMVTADDFGRFKADVRIIKGSCFPVVDTASLKNVAGWLEELTKAGAVVLYTVDGQRFGHFPTWEKHQRPPRARASKFPAPPDMLSNAGQLQTSADKCEQMLPEGIEYGVTGIESRVLSRGYGVKDAEARETEPADTQPPVSQCQASEQRQKTIEECRALQGQLNDSANARAGLVRACAKTLNISEADARALLNGGAV